MPLPPKIDQRIQKRFQDILQAIEALQRSPDDSSGTFTSKLLEDFTAIRTQLLTLLRFIDPNNRIFAETASTIRNFNHNSSVLSILAGITRGLKSDYEAGFLSDLSDLIEANIVADYMGQAEQLLGEGISGYYDYVPAAVLAGAVLEDALRRLCRRHDPPIETNKSTGEPKKLIVLIDDLKREGIYNELKAKQLRAWADIRNAAAHGEFEKFKRSDVDGMLPGIQTFLTDYL